jgi:5'-nucleotidase / UDP-sugar diphosphatase
MFTQRTRSLTRRAFLRQALFAGGAVLGAGGFSFKRALAAPGGPVVFKLRVLFTNDHHSWIEPGNLTLRDEPPPGIRRDFGGVARRKTLLDQLRASAASDENLLLLDAGDVFQGTLYFTEFNGQADLYFYNALAYDAVAVGNHEFDRGQTPIRDFILGANFPVLSANINVQPTATLAAAMAPSDIAVPGKLGKRVIVTKSGKRIGIFGLTTPNVAILSNVGAGVTFTPNLAPIAQTQIDALKADGADYIVALTHVGHTADSQLAAQTSGVNLIVGGHSHTPLLPATNIAPLGVDPQDAYPAVVNDRDGKAVIVVTAWKWGRWLGDITLGFDAGGTTSDVSGTMRPIWAGGLGNPNRTLLPGEGVEIAPDNAVQTQIDTVYKPRLLELEATVIGSTAVALEGNRNVVRNRETNFGNLLADIALQKLLPDGGQIALFNGGAFSSSISAGDVTLARVIQALPFDSSVARVDLTGAQVIAALENAVSALDFANPNNSAGRFAQVSGLRFVWSPNQPVGRRIVSVRVRAPSASVFAPIEPNNTYRVVTTNFLLGGGDAYTVVTQGQNKSDTGIMLVDLLTDYFAANSPVSAAVDGRITVANSIHLPLAAHGTSAR